MPDPRRTLLIALIEMGTGIALAAVYMATPDDIRRARLWTWRTTHRAASAAGRTYGRGGMAAELGGAPRHAERSYRVAGHLASLAMTAETRYRNSLGR